MSHKELSAGEDLFVELTIKNTGKVAGAEVVQLYLNDTTSSVERPLKELKAFEKVWLSPGESKQVTLKLNTRDLSFWDVKQNNWLAEKGEFTVLVGNSSDNIMLSETFTYN
ncbi:fibronectin type III-like domain-contianing protein [Litorilituus lipolyticus]|uniref:fibronectin type III-like domain-contianing protein n=1 Tax=Litorilituus lipolyticus TaxID=2491017 RepID=UPI001FE41C27|nr:fibronectin type III-like domain-contianing protein [Litorilituus lipolyticus]